MEFKVGDVVLLKCDQRIKLTIVEIDSTGHTHCVWYNGHSGNIEFINLISAVLTKT